MGGKCTICAEVQNFENSAEILISKLKKNSEIKAKKKIFPFKFRKIINFSSFNIPKN